MTWRTGLLLIAVLVSLVLWLLVYLLAVTTWRALDEGAPPDPQFVAASAGRAFIVDMDGMPTTTTVAPTTTTTHTHPPRARSAPTVRASRPTPSGDVWWALFGCETGHTYNPQIVSKTGKFRGAFQFSLSTWAGIGETGDPISYSYEHQLAAAKRLQARDGWHPWPTCGRRLGLIR